MKMSEERKCLLCGVIFYPKDCKLYTPSDQLMIWKQENCNECIAKDLIE